MWALAVTIEDGDIRVMFHHAGAQIVE